MVKIALGLQAILIVKYLNDLLITQSACRRQVRARDGSACHSSDGSLPLPCPCLTTVTTFESSCPYACSTRTSVSLSWGLLAGPSLLISANMRAYSGLSNHKLIAEILGS